MKDESYCIDQPRVLLFQYPQSSRLLYLHPTVLVLPMVVGRFADVMPRTNRLDRFPFGFLQNPDFSVPR